ncbi:MAG: haloacid dehalogenase type II [Vulcanimicrobiaceae bacterium]
MTATPLAYVFDLYGTLLDYASLSERFAGRVADPDAFVLAWRQKQLAYLFAATLMDRYVDFETLTGYAFDYTAAAFGIATAPAQRADAVSGWSHLPAFADVPATLAALRAGGAKTAVLSNGTPGGLATALANAGLASHFDAVLSVDAVRKYKPHPSVYRLATERFATSPERIVFVSSNGWDATGAAEFGFRVRWCNRSGAPAETFGAPPERTIASLGDILA